MPDTETLLSQLRFDKDGLVPAVIQDAESKDVLMLGFMNRDAAEKSISERRVCFWSRSRQTFWIKGETSGMTLNIVTVSVNCELNSLLIHVNPSGPTCHTGHNSCYYRIADGDTWKEVAPVLISPSQLYKR